jgi:HD-like signal output (HDOD) protein
LPAEQENDRHTAFSAAILHDIGSVLLATSLPEFYPPALACARSDGIPLHVAEQRVHGFTHAEAGGYLLALWGLPSAIVEAVAHHHHPSRAHEDSFRAAGAVHVADRLCHDQQAHASGIAFEVAHAASLDLDYLEHVQARGQFSQWRALAAHELTLNQ